MRIAVTGANSSVGLNLVKHLWEVPDSQVVACVRSQRAAAALPRSPQIEVRISPYDDADRLGAALGGTSCVVHLAGILIEWPGTSYEEANVRTAQQVVEAATQAGVEHLVLVSVIGASAGSKNRYFRTKGEAEQAFAGSGLSTTIIRTPILFGPGTAGAAALARIVRSGKARLLGGGRYTMRPLDVDDLSRAIVATCRSRPEGVAEHELVGPEPIQYRALVARAARLAGTEVALGSVPIGLVKAGAWLRSTIKRGGVSPTVIDVITMDETVDRNADAELGIALTPLDETLKKILEEERAT